MVIEIVIFFFNGNKNAHKARTFSRLLRSFFAFMFSRIRYELSATELFKMISIHEGEKENFYLSWSFRFFFNYCLYFSLIPLPFQQQSINFSTSAYFFFVVFFHSQFLVMLVRCALLSREKKNLLPFFLCCTLNVCFH